jgi:hypothetical protein
MMHLPRQFQEPVSGIPRSKQWQTGFLPTAYRGYAQAIAGFRCSGHAIDCVAAA